MLVFLLGIDFDDSLWSTYGRCLIATMWLVALGMTMVWTKSQEQAIQDQKTEISYFNH